MVRRGAPGAEAGERRLAYMRYVGQGHEIPVEVPVRRLDRDDAATLRGAYDAAYLGRYGRLIEDIDVEVMSWTLSVAAEVAAAEDETGSPTGTGAGARARRILTDPATGETCEADVFHRRDLRQDAEISGWAVIVEDETTTVVPPSFTARIDGFGHIVMDRVGEISS